MSLRRRAASEYFLPDRFTLLEGRSMLQVYRFGERTVNHYFCKRCGIYAFHDTTERPAHFRVSLGCIAGVELPTLAITLIDGRRF